MEAARLVREVIIVVAIVSSWVAADKAPDLAGFKTVETAQTTTISKAKAVVVGQSVRVADGAAR